MRVIRLRGDLANSKGPLPCPLPGGGRVGWGETVGLSLLALLLSAGCTDFAPLEEGTCGNLVLDRDEDCDGFSAFEGATCGACSYVCDPEDPDLTCPGGWACAADGRCRRPSGAFEVAPGSPWSFPVQDFAIGDVDGDRRADLVGNDETRVRVRFGSPEGAFPTEHEVNIRQPEGPVTFGRFDDDPLLDVIVPIRSGLFALLGDEAGALEPVAYAPFDLGGVRAGFVAVEVIDNLTNELLVIDGTTGELRDLQDTFGTGQAFPLGRSFDDLTPRPPVGDLDGDGKTEVVLAFRGDDRVFVYDLQPVLGQKFEVSPRQQVSLAEGAVGRGALLADVDGDGDLDLMISVDPPGAAALEVAIAENDGGSLGPASVEQVYNRPGPRWPLAAENLGGDAKADYVYPDAVLMTDLFEPFPTPGQLPRSFFPSVIAIDAPWQDAAVGDLNRDGLPDVAVGFEDFDSLEIHLGTGAGIFNTFRVDAGGVPVTDPRSLRIADFDGDFIQDLAFARDGGERGDELTVVFGGTAGGFGAPVSMGRLGQIEDVIPAVFVNAIGAADLVVDLLVVSAFPESGSRALALLQGSSARRMISPFTLDPGSGDAHVPRRAVLGDFAPPADGAQDVFAIAEPPVSFDQEPGDAGVVRSPSIWLAPGLSGDGSLDASETRFSDLGEQLGGGASFEVRCSRWAVGDLDGGGTEELVGLDRAHGCPESLLGDAPATMLIARADPSEGIQIEPVELASPELSGAEELLLEDLDADGDLDLLALFRGGGEGGGALPAVAVFWNQAGALAGGDHSVVQIDGVSEMLAVQPIHLDADGHRDLVVLTGASVYGIRFDPKTGAYGDPDFIAAADGGRGMRAGDVNGDGLEDLAYLFGGEVEILLQRPGAPLGAEQEAP